MQYRNVHIASAVSYNVQCRSVAKVDSEVEKSANASIYLHVPGQVIDGNNSK